MSSPYCPVEHVLNPENNRVLYGMFKWFAIVTLDSILILLFGWLLIKINTSDQQSKFAKAMTISMLTYNVAILTSFFATELYTDTNPETTGGAFVTPIEAVYGLTAFFATIIAYFAFNIGYWYQGFHYFECATEMSFMLRTKGTGDKTALKKRNDLVYKVINWLNILFILAYVGIRINEQIIRQRVWKNQEQDCPLNPVLEVVGRMAIHFCQWNSFIFTIVSTFRISRIVIKHNKQEQLNISMILLLASSCLLYIFSDLIFYCIMIAYWVPGGSTAMSRTALISALIL